ncbi:MAG: hypothetical protein E6R03_06765 [Hyphomicrobiaceae bacterium]|nr:MAG: hypothetical protein E6R03_06765 [Hyphomicrobiaceae bacterium]
MSDEQPQLKRTEVPIRPVGDDVPAYRVEQVARYKPKRTKAVIRPDTPDLIAFLNSIAAIDPAAMHALLLLRVPCNEALADHPTAQVRSDERGASISLLGLLNGYCGAHDDGLNKGCGPVAAVYEDSKFKGFTELGAEGADDLVRKAIEDQLIRNGVASLHNLEHRGCDKTNILTDPLYRSFFATMLRKALRQASAKNEPVIRSLLKRVAPEK